MNVQVVAGTFGGHSAPFAYFNDFTRFETQLTALQETLSGHATFSPQDDELELTLTGDGLGHIAVTGFLAENPHHECGSVLHFNIEMDQTFLPTILVALRKFITAHQLTSKSHGPVQ